MESFNTDCLTVSDILEKYHLTNSQLAARFSINIRNIQLWTAKSGIVRKCPDYVVRMMDECLSTNGINAPDPVDDMPE